MYTPKFGFLHENAPITRQWKAIELVFLEKMHGFHDNSARSGRSMKPALRPFVSLRANSAQGRRMWEVARAAYPDSSGVPPGEQTWQAGGIPRTMAR